MCHQLNSQQEKHGECHAGSLNGGAFAKGHQLVSRFMLRVHRQPGGAALRKNKFQFIIISFVQLAANVRPPWRRFSCSSGRHPPNSLEHFGTGIGLAEKCRAAHGFGLSSFFRITVGGDKDRRRAHTISNKPARQFDARHAAELNVEHQTAKLRAIRVGEKRLR